MSTTHWRCDSCGEAGQVRHARDAEASTVDAAITAAHTRQAPRCRAEEGLRRVPAPMTAGRAPVRQREE